MPDSMPLDGFTVGVTADRRGDEQVLMLSRLGIRVVHGPAIRTLPLAEDGRLRALTFELIARPPAYLVANTGIGIRSWLGMAATWAVDRPLVDALAGTRIVARGPKAAGAVLIAGLKVWWRAPSEQLAEVGQRLLREAIAGQRVAIQLHGDDRQQLGELLRAAGAEVIELPVYRWTLPDDSRSAVRLIELCCEGRIDGLTFTAGPAVQNLFALAREIGAADDLLAILNGGVVVACVGPVCARVAEEEGIARSVVPEHWRLGSLVRVMADELAGRRRSFQLGALELTLQGSLAVVNGERIGLTERERDVLGVLADHVGRTVTRSTLLKTVWSDPRADEHALEVVVGRLRTKLGDAGEAIQTNVRRGYVLCGVQV